MRNQGTCQLNLPPGYLKWRQHSGEIEMPNETMRLTAFFAVALALLYAGWSFQQGDLVVSVCFMLAAIALTVVTRLTVTRQLI